MRALAQEKLPPGVTFEWTDLSFQEAQVGRIGYYIFALSVVFVFLALAAQYESWSLPLAIMLIVPMCLFSAAFGVWLHGREINILTQVGFVVLIALAAKNAILIVEFARQLEEQGKDTVSAAIEACRLRLRPILMTSLAFTLGVVPLYLAVGAGAEMRIALGTAVFWGMIGVTLFGLIFTPVFYVVIRRLTGAKMVARGQAPGAECRAAACGIARGAQAQSEAPSSQATAAGHSVSRNCSRKKPWWPMRAAPASASRIRQIDFSVLAVKWLAMSSTAAGVPHTSSSIWAKRMGARKCANVRRLGERRVAEQELWRHAPSPPFEEGRARHVLAAQEVPGKIADGAHDQRRHRRPSAAARGSARAPPCAASSR